MQVLGQVMGCQVYRGSNVPDSDLVEIILFSMKDIVIFNKHDYLYFQPCCVRSVRYLSVGSTHADRYWNDRSEPGEQVCNNGLLYTSTLIYIKTIYIKMI